MGREYEGIDVRLAGFLLRQPVFFVGTAPLDAEGHVNVSPKGMSGSFAVVDEHRVAYLDLTGSGIETVAHLRENGRIVVMFCAFAGPPRIVRLHGRGETHLPGSDGFEELRPLFPDQPGTRSIIEVEVARIADSCGYAVPEMTYVKDRQRLTYWAEAKERDGALTAYQTENNATSLDGLPGLPGPDG
ncbi:MAG TPA: pyridoxamine 5'-phosphate oxidase family protein [Acidimicrobiales bacterium]|nr:pyridoxamine 5'-phosphate oxidase family protein [Acidimicrobiales bacterium]